jgi:phage-related baseplate assembly protein
MAETLPRWNLPEVSFVQTDPEKIKAEIICNFESVSGRTLATADPVRMFLLSVANIIIQQRVLINMAARNNLLSYATGNYLDALGSYLQVNRLGASAAVAEFEFTLSMALAEIYSIPQGTEITNGVVTFRTNEELLIPAGELIGKVSASCTVAGEEGNNYLAGQITTLVKPLTFVANATNTNTTYGGAEQESDESYAERIRLAPNSFSVAGSIKAYIFHTYSVSPAIVDVSVDSPTPGVVNVYPLLNGGQIPDATLREEILEYLSSDDIRPLTDEVNVLEAIAVPYSINVRYFIRNEDRNKGETIQKAVAEAVENYRNWQQGKIGRDIIPSELVRKIRNAGAYLIDSGMLPSEYRKLEKTEVAQCSPENVTVSFGGYVEG